MEVSGQHHTPAALHPGQELPVPIGLMAVLAPELAWTQWRRKKFSHCMESNLSRPAHNLVSILTAAEQ